MSLPALFDVAPLRCHVGLSSWVQLHGPIRFGAVPRAPASFTKGIAACLEWYSKNSLDDVSLLPAVMMKPLKRAKASARVLCEMNAMRGRDTSYTAKPF
jgi:hypothetical protein